MKNFPPDPWVANSIWILIFHFMLVCNNCKAAEYDIIGSCDFNGEKGITSSPSVGYDSTIYIGIHTFSTNQNSLSAISEHCLEKWNFPTESEVYASSIDRDGTIYAVTENKLIAISSNGVRKWEVQKSYFSYPAIGPDGTIYIGRQGDAFYAINSLDGSIKWSTTSVCGGASPAIGGDGTIYTYGCDNSLHALNPDGSLKWTYYVACLTGTPPSIDLDGTIYAGGWERLSAINPDGTEKWTFHHQQRFSVGAAIGLDGTIYTSTDTGHLFAIDPNGTQKWMLSNQGTMGHPAVGTDGIIYMPAGDNLIANNPDGTQKWTVDTSPSIFGLSLTSNGTLIAAGYLNLYTFKLSSGWLANSPWPMISHDPQHTGRQPSKNPSTKVLEDFESIPIGPIAGMHGWDNTSSGKVILGEAVQGNNSLVIDTFGTVNNFYGGLAGYQAKTAYISMYVKGVTSNTEGGYNDIHARLNFVFEPSHTNFYVNLCRAGEGLWSVLPTADPIGNDQCINGVGTRTMEQWSRLDIEINLELSNMRVRLGGSQWSDFVDRWGAQTQFALMSIQNTWTTGDQTHIDFITIGNEESAEYSIRRLSQTKYGVDSIVPQNDNSWVNTKEDNSSPYLITHALYPFQLFPYQGGYMTGDFLGFKWVDNDLLPQMSEDLPSTSDENRQPLILIHGWQANKNGDYLNRDPVELSKHPDSNYYDAEGYWWTFLRYFATNDDLKKKYKIYLYQYPSYKHITFNARMLSNMLYETKYIKDWVSQGKKITILGHSMGGLVARSFLEEHGGIWFREGAQWKLFKSGEVLLDKLITLDTPHHGSPAAVYPWIDAADYVRKDVYSPGALDLWWDGYDGAYVKLDDNDLDECPFGPPEGISTDSSNSWRDLNESNFDNHYRIELGDLDGRDIVGCLGTAFVHFYDHPNPWLSYLNTIKHSRETWRNKYIFYGGYNDAQTSHWANKLEDTSVIGGGDNFWFSGVWEAGYLNDSPVPVTSSFFDKTEKVADHDGWPSSDQIGMFWEFIYDKTKNILISVNDDNFKIRFFRDYHHDRMLNGAYYHPQRGYTTFYNPTSCLDRNTWFWDVAAYSELQAPCSNEQRLWSGFRTAEIRLNYIDDTGVHLKLDELTVSNSDTSKDATWKSTLEYEPLFLMLKKDLCSVSGDFNVDCSINLKDVILGLKILTATSEIPLSAGAELSGDGKIGLDDIIILMNYLLANQVD